MPKFDDKSFDRFRIRRESANPTVVPSFPELPKIRANNVEELASEIQSIFSNRNASLDDWRNSVQNIINHAIMALKLDKESTLALIKQELDKLGTEGGDEASGALDEFVKKSGDSISYLTIEDPPRDDNHAVTKRFVEDFISDIPTKSYSTQNDLVKAPYVYDRTNNPGTIWTITHNLGYKPAVRLLNNDNYEYEAMVRHFNDYKLEVRHTTEQYGMAVLS